MRVGVIRIMRETAQELREKVQENAPGIPNDYDTLVVDRRNTLPVTPAKVTSRSRTTMRTKVVWSVLGIGMSLSVAMLLVLDPGASRAHGGGVGGVSLSPLMGIDGSLGMDSIFQTTTPIEPARWSSIVIVHSGSLAGSPSDIAREHRELGYDGLGYHFVIGNGTRMGDGEIHVGYRWIEQRDGAELAGLGDHGFSDGGSTQSPSTMGSSSGVIEICLVGDGDRHPFTDEQLHRLAQVVTALSKRLDIPSDRIRLHKDLAGTTSPGRYFPQAEFEQMLASMG